jgi:hypothetical protein
MNVSVLCCVDNIMPCYGDFKEWAISSVFDKKNINIVKVNFDKKKSSSIQIYQIVIRLKMNSIINARFNAITNTDADLQFNNTKTLHTCILV